MNTTTADAAAASTFALPENVGLTGPPLEGAALNPVPGWTEVLREQLASVGLALRREATVVAGLATLFTGFVVLMQVQTGDAQITLSPLQGIAAVVAALLVPMAVWKGEDPARRGYHHAMPVDQGAHAVARGAAGLAWTMAAVAAFFGWMGLMSAFTGGSVETAEPWQWMAPFAGAAVAYLLGSAVTLVTSHPWRWFGGGLIGYLFLNTGFRAIDATRPLVDAVNAILTGKYGLTTVITGLVRNDNFLQNLGPVMIADAGAWLTAIFLWLAAGISLFLWAAYRQPER